MSETPTENGLFDSVTKTIGSAFNSAKDVVKADIGATNQAPAPTANPATPTATPTATTEPKKTSFIDRIKNFFGTANTVSATATALAASQGGTRRRRKKSSNKTKGRIDFSKIKWGSFTKVYNRYIKKRPHMKSKIPTLKQFAHYVNKNSKKFNKKTHKKALFYTNIIEKK